MTWTVLTSASTTSGSLANWMSKSSISSGTDGVADTIIGEAESWIYRRLRHWRMLTPPQSFTLTANVDTVAVTAFSGFLEPMEFWYLNNGGPYWMVQKTPAEVYSAWIYNSDNTRVSAFPIIYSFNDTYIQMDSPPLDSYPAYLTYYKQLDGLSSTNTTNFLTIYYPRLMRCACMAAACEWAKDNGQGSFDRTYWDQLAQDEIDKAQAESDRARRGEINAAVLVGGSGLTMPAYAGAW